MRWADRVGKGIRTAPRDALVADSIDESQRGLAFGFHRAADTGGAVVGLLIALGVVWAAQAASVELGQHTFQIVVLVSLVPAVLAVLSLALGARDVPVTSPARAAGHHASEGWVSHSWSSWSSSACSTWATRRTPFWCCAPRSAD